MILRASRMRCLRRRQNSIGVHSVRAVELAASSARTPPFYHVRALFDAPAIRWTTTFTISCRPCSCDVNARIDIGAQMAVPAPSNISMRRSLVHAPRLPSPISAQPSVLIWPAFPTRDLSRHLTSPQDLRQRTRTAMALRSVVGKEKSIAWRCQKSVRRASAKPCFGRRLRTRDTLL